MIRLITGLPGSGKTYFAVNEILSLNFKFDKDYFRYYPTSDIVIFTNIENLKLDSISLPHYLKERNLSIDDFFTVEFQQKLVDKYKKVVYLIDEAQKFFPKKYYNPDVFFFFQYHRHLGIDIYLITQNFYLLPSAITSLVEYEIKAVRQTNRFKNIFRYHFVSSGDIIAKKSLKADKLIFSLYTSAFASPSLKNAPNPLKKYSFLFVLLVLIVISSFFFFIHSFFPSSPHHSSSSAVRSAATARTHKADVYLKHYNLPKRIYKPVTVHSYSRDSYSSSSYVRPKPDSFKLKPKPAYTVIYTGGVWDSLHHLRFILLDGSLIPVQNFPYRYLDRGFMNKLIVWLPSSYFKHSTVSKSSHPSSSPAFDNSSNSILGKTKSVTR